mmetsp:Transcript_108310/g.305354  ORF Transcript_108310/g.305354 Transcript_108310/m.305354 type:complete len:259 (+) Transcript_108310:145-921(+)
MARRPKPHKLHALLPEARRVPVVRVGIGELHGPAATPRGLVLVDAELGVEGSILQGLRLGEYAMQRGLAAIVHIDHGPCAIHAAALDAARATTWDHVPHEFGLHPTRVHTICGDALVPLCNLRCVQNICEFRLCVRLALVVLARLPMEVVELYLASLAHIWAAGRSGARGKVNNTGRRALLQHVLQQLREQEVAEVVGAHLQLEAILCVGKWREHDSRIVHQNVQAVILGLERVAERPDTVQARQVQLHEDAPSLFCR